MKVNIPEWECERIAAMSLDRSLRNRYLLGLEVMVYDLKHRPRRPKWNRQIVAAENRIALLKLLTNDPG